MNAIKQKPFMSASMLEKWANAQADSIELVSITNGSGTQMIAWYRDKGKTTSIGGAVKKLVGNSKK